MNEAAGHLAYGGAVFLASIVLWILGEKIDDGRRDPWVGGLRTPTGLRAVTAMLNQYPLVFIMPVAGLLFLFGVGELIAGDASF